MIKFWRVSEPYGFLSNWWLCPITYKNKTFCSSEQLFMWLKAELFDDEEVGNKILATTNQKDIKALGRQVKNFDQLIWDAKCFELMYIANYFKFSQNLELRKLLYAIRYQVLVEASPYDKIWGIGLTADDPRTLDVNQWLGTNLLGKCLMQVSNYFESTGWNLGE